MAVIESDLVPRHQSVAYGTDDDLTLPGLLRALGRGSWLIAMAALASLLAGVVILKSIEPQYTATMVVAPAGIDLGAASRLATNLEHYANLATLGQTPVKLEQVAPIERYIELLTSVRLARRLARDHGMVKRVFAGSWDQDSRTWKPPSGAGKLIAWDLPSFFGYPNWTPPDPRTLAGFLEDAMEVGRIDYGALRKIQLKDADPELARELLQAAHEAANSILHAQMIAGIDRQIDQVTRKLSTTQSPREREALEAVLVEQHEAKARISAAEEVGAEFVNAPEASARPTSPHPLLILSLFLAGGVALGVFAVVLRELLAIARSQPS